MTKKLISNVGASVRQRLLNLRDKTGEDFNALLTQFAIERFLYRLSRSPLADRVVLKGAMLFRVWSGSLHRPTKDVDLLGAGEATTAAVTAMIRQIITTAVEDDGILFDADSVKAEEIRENQEYGGIRATFRATLDKAVIPLQVDVGFGDAITPAAEERMYPVLIDMAAPRLRMYPVETVVAEKREARGCGETRHEQQPHEGLLRPARNLPAVSVRQRNPDACSRRDIRAPRNAAAASRPARAVR